MAVRSTRPRLSGAWHQQTKQGPDPYEVAAKIVECTRPVLDRYAGFIYLTEAEIP